MYKQVEVALLISNISKKELAKKLGISYNTLLLKLRGVSKFTLDEAFMVKGLLGLEESIDELFSIK